MRILSWNINGIRTLPQYHPWNTFKSCQGILQELHADIICFQEMKTTRPALDRSIAVPDSYDAFFSFPVSKGGYSGVTVYTKSTEVVPLKAEEGLTGNLQPKPPLAENERISLSYPSILDLELVPDEKGNAPTTLGELDTEGRALVLDFGLFVLINVYCPAITSEERYPFKMNFHRLLGERIRRLVELDKREVILAGDINCVAAPIDHGEGSLPSTQKDFWDQPHRVWLRNLLAPAGPFADVVRRSWPDRQGMFTCWNTRISARESNYGTRIDYILCTQGLLPWVKGGDIQASAFGSDHCPVYVDLHDEIVDEHGTTHTLRTALGTGSVRREPPRLAAKFWDEYSGKQTLLSAFFRKPSDQSSPTTASASSLLLQALASAEAIEPPTPITEERTSGPILASQSRPLATETFDTPSTGKRKNSSPPPQSKKKKVGQTKLSTFFGKQDPAPAPSSSRSSTSSSKVKRKTSTKRTYDDADEPPSSQITSASDVADQIEADYLLAQALESESAELHTPSPTQPSSQSQSKTTWSQLLAPLQPPNCDVHNEPAKQLKVTKTGPNKGKAFFICSRPLGPGHDSGKGKRLREEVDPQYKCNYFKWASDVRRESLQPR